MSFLHDNRLAEMIGRRFERAVRSRYGGLFTNAVPRAAAEWAVSLPTARKAFHGELTSAPVLLRALASLGEEAARWVLEPVIGTVHIKESARHVEEIATANREGLRRAAAVLGFGAADMDRKAGHTAGRQDQPGKETGLALVSTRRSLDACGSTPALRRTLNLFKPGAFDYDSALYFAANDPSIGVAHRSQGGDWIVSPAKGNRLWGGSTGPRPLSHFPCPVYANRVREGFEEALASPVPIAFRHAGALLRDGVLTSIHADVVRIGSRRPGIDICVASFEKLAA